MNLDKIRYYNLGDREELPGYGLNGLIRIPKKIRNVLNERARFIGMDSVGIEIQFVTDAPNIELLVSTQDPLYSDFGEIRIYKGNFLHKIININPGITKKYSINPPEDFSLANDEMLCNKGFSPNVWRMVCNNSTIVLHGINVYGHDIRPPKKDEIPNYDWLAYGSSITNSSLDGYPHFAASKLKVQVQNKGFHGSCHIEKELVDYMLDECGFDFITCELGVNMRDSFSVQEFEIRATYLINRLIALRKPAMIITTFPNSQSKRFIRKENDISRHETAFNDILIKLVDEADCPYIKLINGYNILDDINGLSADLIHPTNYGHAIMGNNLAHYLRMFLLDCGLEI